jgi:hypothetical protein
MTFLSKSWGEISSFDSPKCLVAVTLRSREWHTCIYRRTGNAKVRNDDDDDKNNNITGNCNNNNNNNNSMR